MEDIFEMAAAAAVPDALIVIDDDDDDDDDDFEKEESKEEEEEGSRINNNNDDSSTNVSIDLLDDISRISRHNTESSPSPPLFTPESQKRRLLISPPPQKQPNLMTLLNEKEAPPQEPRSEQCTTNDSIKYDTIRDSGVGMCGICYCPFDEDAHLMSCLRCGHIFGKPCITRWLNSKPRNEKVCPICKARSTPSQIIVLYAPQLTEPSVPPDENENRKLRLDIIEAKRQNFILHQLNEDLKKEVASVKEKYEQLKTQVVHDRLFGSSGSASKSGVNQNVYRRILDENNKSLQDPKKSKSESYVNQFSAQNRSKTRQNFEISSAFGAIHTERVHNGRVLEYFNRENVLFYSTEFQKGKYGVMMHSLLDRKSKTRLNICHSEPIRDMAVNNENGILVTASSDKRLKLCRINSKNEIMECLSPVDIWSCCWDANDPRYFYCGRKDGEVCMYDSRKTESFVCSAGCGLKMPIHSLYSLRMMDGEVGLIVGSIGGISYLYGSRAGISDCGIIQRDKCIGISKPHESFGQTLIAASFRGVNSETIHRTYIIEQRVTHHKKADEILEPAFEFKNNAFSSSLGKPSLISGHDGQTFLVTNNGTDPEIVLWSLDDDGKPAFIKSSLDERLYPRTPALNILSFEKDKNPYFASITTTDITIFGNII